jgi:hypothetical protein
MMIRQKLSVIVTKLNPAVPRRYLYFIAGVLWMIAGTILFVRGIQWMESFSFQTEIELEGIIVAASIAGYLFLFSRIVQKNIDRIKTLPERTCLFAFTAFRGYAMIAAMIILGLYLRSTSIPKFILTIPYSVMGSMLLIGSAVFYRQFAVSLRTETF